MNLIRAVGCAARVLAALAAAALAYAAAAPAALADPRPPHPPPGWYKHPPLPAHAHPMISGGMPGWQIALIATAAVLLAAAVAVTMYRTRAGRRAAATA